MRFGTPERDYEWVMRQLRSGRDEAGRACSDLTRSRLAFQAW